MIDNDQNYVYEGHSVDFFTERTIAFLETQRSSRTPFFAFVPYNGPYGHWPAIRGRSATSFADLYDQTPLNSVPREGLLAEQSLAVSDHKDLQNWLQTCP